MSAEHVEDAEILDVFAEQTGQNVAGDSGVDGGALATEAASVLASSDLVDTEIDTASPAVVRAVQAAEFTHLDVTTVNPKIADDGAFLAEWSAEVREVQADLEKNGLPAEEVDARIMLLKTRLGEAHSRAKAIEKGLLDAGTSVKIMGLFTAPEWFFKNPGTPFTLEDKEKVYQTFIDLSAEYDNMVIMPGTVVWRDKGTGFFTWPKNKRKATMANSSPVMLNGELVNESNKWLNAGDTEGYGGATADENHMATEHGGKIKSSGELSKANEEYGRGRGTKLGGVDSPNSVQGDSTFFDAGGVTFSREICGDHSSNNRARSDFAQQDKPADVHVVLSHGSGYYPNRAPVGQGGIGVHNNAQDGSADPRGGALMQSKGAVYTANGATTEKPFEHKVAAHNDLERGKMGPVETEYGGTSHLGTYTLGDGGRLPTAAPV